MFIKKKAFAMASAALAFGFYASTANAASINSLLFPNQLNQLSDNSGESIGVDAGGEGHAERVVRGDRHDAGIGADELVHVLRVTGDEIIGGVFSQ